MSAAHSERLERRAARVLVVDPDGRVLLMRAHDPAVPQVRHWFTVGGGIEPGETVLDGARRELLEETGLQVQADHLVGPLYEDRAEFGFGRFWVVQDQQYFAVRVESGWRPAPAALEPAEVETVDAWSWWTVDQLRAQAAGVAHDGPGRPDEIVYPAVLADLADLVDLVAPLSSD